MGVAPDLSQSAGAVTHPVSQSRINPLPVERLLFYFTLGIGLIAAGMAVLYFSLAIQWGQKPFLGVMTTPYMVVDGSLPITPETWAGINAGLRRLDRLISINGQPILESPADYTSGLTNFRRIIDGLKIGDTVNVVFERADATNTGESADYCGVSQNGVRQCQLSFILTPLPRNDFLTYFVVPYFAGLITIIIGIAVAYLRRNQQTAQVIALFSITLGIFMAGVYDTNNGYHLLPLWLVGTLFMGGFLGTLALIFPVKISALFQRPQLQWLPLAVNTIIALVGVFWFFNPQTPYDYPDIWQLGVFYAILMLVLITINLVRRRAVATSPAIRDQTNTVLIGVALSLAPIAIWILDTILRSLFNSTIFAINSSALMPFFVMPSVAMAYAVLQYRRDDTDRVISQGITYTVILIGLILAYFLLVFGSNLFAGQALQLGTNDFIAALTIFALAVLFLPARTYLQRRIDRIYYRQRTLYQERVEAFTRGLSSQQSLDQNIQMYRQELQDSLSIDHAFIFMLNRSTHEYVAYGNPLPESDISFETKSSLIAFLNREEQIYLDSKQPWPSEVIPEKSRLTILKARVVTPMRGRKELLGFICIGPPRVEGGQYNFEELRFIQNLTGQLAISVERAQVVESLERRVRELDVLSQVSQAVNFTIEFDDLLELIYAQTDRLISASYFYIVLRERAADKLYYAMFVEDADRHTERENRRWGLGRDLFSDVIRNGTAIGVDDYALEMQKRGSPIIYESLNLKSWMGVPLVAGSSVLGVLAVSNTESGKKYTDDQLKVLNDIGTLAATSLDKARLFGETNLRARQLGALNEISQKLATELNVENLLELITESAVNILNAEAGALLLWTNDSNETLEFKVAVGGSGENLLGKQVAREHTLAGEVASKGKPIIVNDTAADSRWGGEVAKGGFNTSAVLAVPLIAQNKVVGVLEVINKKDGSVYVEEDADLLTTFAGQAAVALENARLFQMTDLQLGQRVTELEALERIDVELNRSLDLQRVADITMRYAIANTRASAGVLGIVANEPPHLEIVSMHGYKAEDYPEGAEGKIWPLDRGIVHRVMRTRQPDLQTSLSLDPSYIPSLREANSQLTIPIMSAGEINAILVLEKDKDTPLSLIDLSFAQRLAEHASIAISNAQINEELTRANESKSEFVSFVAHELKTPMTSMKGYTDLLLSGVVGNMNEQQVNFLSTIRSNIDRMNTLVSDLNDVTKLQTNNLTIEPAPVDFQNIVTETLRPLTKQIHDKGQEVILDLSTDLPRVIVDQNRIIQVMTNLVSNAHKYSPEGSNIRISADVRKKNLDARGRDQGPALHVSVKDNGIGMTEEDTIKLFTPYFRSDNPLARQQPGTGLGLTIVRGIIEQHRGQIWVESQLGSGTTFHFTLPIIVESQAEPQPVR